VSGFLASALARVRAFSPGAPTPQGSRTAGERVYAIGDVHGCYDLLKALLGLIAADAAGAPGKRPVLVFCGDYIDRGPCSAEVVEALVCLKRRRDLQIHLLKGNHEQGMLHFLADPEAGAAWLRFGGRETLASYGVAAPEADAGGEALRAARDALLSRMPASHLSLLHELALMVVVGDYAFVHAGVRPGAPLSRQAEADLLWIRDPFLDWDRPFERVIVHGHTWRDGEPQLLGHRIGIDTGAYATGVLTAVRLEDEDVSVIQARAEGAEGVSPALRVDPVRC
jgi:serine/threonine protein phosphatase 1